MYLSALCKITLCIAKQYAVRCELETQAWYEIDTQPDYTTVAECKTTLVQRNNQTRRLKGKSFYYTFYAPKWEGLVRLKQIKAVTSHLTELNSKSCTPGHTNILLSCTNSSAFQTRDLS